MHTSRRVRERFPNDLTKQVSRDGQHPVASGGFADIYRGWLRRNRELNKVAIKAIKCYTEEGGSASKKKHKRLRREIKVWLDLRHDNVLPLLGTTMGFGKFPAMVCPWAENGSLTKYLEQCYDSLSTSEKLGLLNNVASGLQYLHSRSVVHGDLSGSNVLIRDGGRACIADFGLSMLLTELGGSTFATSFHARGTLRWTAPELLDLEVHDEEEESAHMGPTTESDVYSFGSIMLQILSGKVPYHYYRREAQVLHAVSKGRKPERPSNTMVTDDRWTFMKQCWTGRLQSEYRPSSEEIVAFVKEELATNEKSNGARELTRPESVLSTNSSETSLDALSLLLPPRVGDRVRIPTHNRTPSPPLSRDSSPTQESFHPPIPDPSNPNPPIAAISTHHPSTSHVPTRQVNNDDWSASEELEHSNRGMRRGVPVVLPPLYDVQPGVSSWYRPGRSDSFRNPPRIASRAPRMQKEVLRVGHTDPEDATYDFVPHPPSLSVGQYMDRRNSGKNRDKGGREGGRDLTIEQFQDRIARMRGTGKYSPAPVSEKRTGVLSRLRRLLGIDDQA